MISSCLKSSLNAAFFNFSCFLKARRCSVCVHVDAKSLEVIYVAMLESGNACSSWLCSLSKPAADFVCDHGDRVLRSNTWTLSFAKHLESKRNATKILEGEFFIVCMGILKGNPGQRGWWAALQSCLLHHTAPWCASCTVPATLVAISCKEHSGSS